MITVQININGNCICARSATRIEDPNEKKLALYKSDCGRMIEHNPDDGAVKLAKKLLDFIEEK